MQYDVQVAVKHDDIRLILMELIPFCPRNN